MDAKELDKIITKTIEQHNLYGHSFTRAVGFITLMLDDYFWAGGGGVEDIEWQLAELVDIAIIDDIITNYIDGEEEEA